MKKRSAAPGLLEVSVTAERFDRLDEAIP